MSPNFLVDKYFYVKHGSFSFVLREKCPNTEYFLVRIFLYSDWIRNSSCHTVRYARCVATWWSLKVGGNRKWLFMLSGSTNIYHFEIMWKWRYKLIRSVAELFSRIFLIVSHCVNIFRKREMRDQNKYEYGHFYAVSFIPFILFLPWWVSL